MIIVCRSVFSRKYEEKIKGSLLRSHPLRVHTGQAVMAGSISTRTLASPWSVWGSGVICLSPPMSRASASREVCWSQRSQLPESAKKWDGYVVRPIAHPLQLNQNQQASLSQHIRSFKVFVTSLCPSHLNSSMHPRKRCLCTTHSCLHAGDIKEEAVHQHHVKWRQLIFMFAAYTRFPDAVWLLLGVLRLPSSH